MDESNLFVVHHLDALNYIVTIFPVIVLIIVYGIHYGIVDKSDRNRENESIPSPSDIIQFQPAYRIFSVGMLIEALLIFLILYIRGKVRFIIANKAHKSDTKKFNFFLVFSNVSMVMFFIGFVILAVCPFGLDFNRFVVYSLGLQFFGYGAAIHFVIYDMFGAYIGYPSQISSRLLTWIIIATHFIEIVIRCYICTNGSVSSQQWWSMSTFFGIVGMAAIFVKISLSSKDIPQHTIRLSRKNL